MSDVLDVSGHQGAIDWGKVAGAGHRFAYLKATEGASLYDKTFDKNRKGAESAGLRWGAYHFLHVLSTPKAQADAFLAALSSTPANMLPPVLDVEWIVRGGRDRWLDVPKAERPAWVIEWLTIVESKLGVRPAIYTGRSFWRDRMGDVSRVNGIDFGSYRLWVPSYTSASSPRLPAPWNSWWLWQYSSTGNVPGVSTNVDMNRASPAFG